MKKFRLPYGVMGYLGNESYAKESLEKKLAKVFYLAGFEKVEPAVLEYLELYQGIASEKRIARMFKLMDTDGKMLVLRPDITPQISRLVALRGEETPITKLYYVGDSYEYLADPQSTRDREFAQVGIEMIGNSSVEGDIEVIILAIEALKTSGLKDFLIDIGNINFAEGILEENGLTGEKAKELRKAISNKDALGIAMLAKEKKIKESVLAGLESLYGGIEVLERAQKFAVSKKSQNALDDLSKIMTALDALGLSKYVSVDLGMLKGSYYTGLVIRGIAKDLGVSILEGGRYDALGAEFDKPSEAVGFAVGTKRLLLALEKQNAIDKPIPCDIAYINMDGISKEEFEEITKLKKAGKRAIKLYTSDKKQLLDYCKKNNIKKAIVFAGEKMEEVKS